MRPVLSAFVLAAATSGLVALGSARAEPAAAPSAKGAPSAKAATKAKRPAKRRARVAPGGGARPRAAVEPAPATHRRTPSLSILPGVIRCPHEMVKVAGRFCIDRHEAALVEAETGVQLSPHYPPSAPQALALFETWSATRATAPPGTLAHALEVPPPVLVQGRARAVSAAGVLPSGYVSGGDARRACEAAGKRLCRETEWVTACRGEEQTTFPYGASYRQDSCNVFREDHPARLLHGSASRGHLDPRLNLVEVKSGPLLRKTGESPACASRWGDDAVFDMVGNLDEWIDDPGGTFVGGFYSRATRAGCDARVSTHAFDYADYSTGFRCCADPEPSPG